MSAKADERALNIGRVSDWTGHSSDHWTAQARGGKWPLAALRGRPAERDPIRPFDARHVERLLARSCCQSPAIPPDAVSFDHGASTGLTTPRE